MAAYQAKSGGRNRLEIHCELVEAAKQSRLDLDLTHFEIERVRHAFASAGIVGLEGEAVAATLSAGVAQRADATVSAVAFVNQASKALLEAKGTGRNRVVLAD